MQRFRTWTKTFLLFAAWDWLVTAGTIYMAERDYRAIPLAVALTAFWWFAVRLVQNDRRLLPIGLLGAGAGTALGMYWP